MRDYTYIALSAKRENTPPWMLLRESNRRLSRWVPHLNCWISMSGHWDWLSGFSSDSLLVDARTVSKAEARSLRPVVADLSAEDVERYRDRRLRPSRTPRRYSTRPATPSGTKVL